MLLLLIYKGFYRNDLNKIIDYLNYLGIDYKIAINNLDVTDEDNNRLESYDFILEDMNYSDIEELAQNFKSILVISSNKVLNNFNEEQFDKVSYLLKNFYNMSKKIGAIEFGILVLGVSGILDGVRVSAISSIFDKTPNIILESYGAILEENPIVIDNNIITTSNSSYIEEVIEELIV